MKRVFHIITHFDMGGAEQVAVSIAESDNKDIEYHIVEIIRADTDYTKVFVNNLSDAGIHYHRSHVPEIKFHFLFERLAAMLFPFWFIFLFLRYKPDVIHAHTEVPDMSVFAFFKVFPFLLRRCRVVRTIHNTRLWTGQKRLGAMVERFYKEHDANIAISLSTQQSYKNVYGQLPPIIYNGVSPTAQKVYPHLVKDKVNILFAGRFESQKGIDTLLEIIKRLRDNDKYLFHIIGDGSMKQAVMQCAGSCGNVVVSPPVFGLSSYLSSFDYLLMPSEFEGLSILALEASFNGLPVIANDCPGLGETLPEDWPLKVEDNDAEAYIRIFNEVLPNADRKALALMSYKYAEAHFSIRKMRQRYEYIYLHTMQDFKTADTSAAH